jgi:hypothetical protein
MFCIHHICRENKSINDCTSAVYRLKETYDLVRFEPLRKVPFEFCIPMNLVRVINICLNKTYSKVRLGSSSDAFRVRNYLMQENYLLPLFLYFALEYTIRNVKENQAGLKFNVTHQLLVYANVNLLCENLQSLLGAVRWLV